MQHQRWKKGILKGAILIIIMALMIAQPLEATFQPVMHNDQPRASTDWWSMFHHDPSHTGYSSSVAPNTNTVLWSFSTGAEISGSPILVNDKVYVGSWDQKLYCLNATTGTKLWDYTTGLEVNSVPTVVEDKVYCGSNDGKLYCLNADTGEKIWDYQCGADVVSSPAVVNGNVYFGSRDHKVYCLDATTGAWIWDYTTGMDIIPSPAVVDGKLYIGSWDNKVYCLDATTGTWIWEYATGDDMYSSPAVDDGKVFIGSQDQKLYCLDAATGAWIWDYTTGASIESSPAVIGGRVYVGSFDNKMYCFNESTGVKLWEYSAGDYFYSSPAIADGKLYASAFDNKFYCLNADTGALIWTYPTGSMNWASPAIAEGKMILASGNHKVYCFQDPNTPPETPAAPDGPVNGTIHVNYTFTATTTDPQGDDIFYLFDWNDGTNSSWLGPYPSGSTVNASHAWATEGNYSITVKAKDASGLESGWSSAHIIAIVEVPILKIQNITGGFLKAKTYIKNVGNAPAFNVHWTFGTANGTILVLVPGDERKITSNRMFGFGRTVLKVTAACDESSDSRQQNAFIFLFFVIVT
jgi:outer membrane protein assembly factor BamB